MIRNNSLELAFKSWLPYKISAACCVVFLFSEPFSAFEESMAWGTLKLEIAMEFQYSSYPPAALSYTHWISLCLRFLPLVAFPQYSVCPLWKQCLVRLIQLKYCRVSGVPCEAFYQHCHFKLLSKLCCYL